MADNELLPEWEDTIDLFCVDEWEKARRALKRELRCGMARCIREAKADIRDADDRMDWRAELGRWRKKPRQKIIWKGKDGCLTVDDLPWDPRT